MAIQTRGFGLMHNRKQLNEVGDKIEDIVIKRATSSDIRKGETYVVHDGKKIVKYKGVPMTRLKRDSAKQVAATNPNWVVASSEFAFDKGIVNESAPSNKLDEAVVRVPAKKDFKDSDLVVARDKDGNIQGHMWYVAAKDIYEERIKNGKVTLEYSVHNGPENVRKYKAHLENMKTLVPTYKG